MKFLCSRTYFALFELQAATERRPVRLMCDKRQVTLSIITSIDLACSLQTARYMTEAILDHSVASQSTKWAQIQRST